MAALTITAGSVGVSSNAIFQAVQVGEAVTHMQPVYLDAATGKYMKDDADTADVLRGVTLTAAATDGTAIIATGGDVIPGATLTVGETYVVGTTAGQIVPIGDLASGDWSKIVGVASSASLLSLVMKTAAAAKA